MADPSTHDTGLPANYEPLDPGRVDMQNPVEVQYWCNEFDCTQEELREAVAGVGDHAAALREHLASQR